MASLVIFSLSTGAPIRRLEVQHELAGDQCGDDEYAINISDFPLPDTNWTNTYLDVSTSIVKVLPPKPSEHHVFDYATKQWVDQRTPETEWPLVRAERDRRLLASDWTQLPDVPLTTKEAWAVYRQALRDITEQPDPFNIVWPEPPQ